MIVNFEIFMKIEAKSLKIAYDIIEIIEVVQKNSINYTQNITTVISLFFNQKNLIRALIWT